MRYGPLRLAVAVTGALLLLIAVGAWVDPDKVGGRLGLTAENMLGHATLRADLGAFFSVGGGLALVAAWRRNARLLTAPLLMIAVALAGRIVTLEFSEFDPTMLPPMLAEAVMVAVFAAGRLVGKPA